MSTQKPVKGNPASSLPMPGLSKRAQEALKPRAQHMRSLVIEPAGSGVARHFKNKAAL